MAKVFASIDKTVLPFYKILYKLVLLVCKLLLVMVILVTAFSVLARYLPFMRNPVWTEELVLSGMAYMALISASLGIARRSHIRMSSFDKYLPKKLIYVLDVLADVAVIILAVVMIVVGFQYAQRIGRFGSFIALPLSRFWMYFPVPLAGSAIILFQLESLYTNVKKFFVKEDVVL